MTLSTTLPGATEPISADPAPEQPELSFDALPLSSELRATLADMGYEHPTPVQLAVWEPVTRGRDAVVQARTGTGKTAAFGMPIVDHIVRRTAAHVQVLVLSPTRELALQISRELDSLAARKPVSTVAIYGGAPMPRQVEQLAGGAQVVVGTPGRVLDHLRRGTLDASNIRLLVLDESDEMLSMGFERELNAILDHLPKDRQTVLFSATVPPDIERIAKNKLKAPEFVTLSGDAIGALSIEHYVYMVAADKLSVLVRVLEVENPESAVIFCNTKDETERVAQALSQKGYEAAWLNGDLAQSDREKVMQATRSQKLRFLVATDVAARGIDISHLTHVINFDFPQDAETYVHRTGRTGRAGRTGTAISLITPQDIGGLYLLRLTYKIRPIERQIPTAGELKTRAEADLVAMLAEAFLAAKPHPEDLALSRRLLSHDQAETIIAGMLRNHLGARPTAQDEASAARRTSRPMRPLRGRFGRTEAPVSTPEEKASPSTASSPAVVPSTRAEAAPAAPSLPSPRPRRDRDQGREQGRDHGRGRERGHERDRGPRREPQQDPVSWSGARQDAESAVEPASRPSRDDEPRRGESESAASSSPSLPRPTRHADFATWQPPEEEGDDQPILADGAPRGRAEARAEAPLAPASRRAPAPMAPVASGTNGGAAPQAEGAPSATASADEASFVDVFVNAGRRDGVRAAELARLLTERAALKSEDIHRIRVRERNAFISVRREDLARVVDGLSGASIGTKTLSAEPARGASSSAPDSETNA